MSRFRAALDAEIQKIHLPKAVPKVPKGGFGTFGTERESRVSRNADGFGTFGTAQGRRVSGNEAPAPDPAELDERAAMALEGGVPAVYADAFSRLQLQRPTAVDEPTWRRAIDDAGRFLDTWGKLAPPCNCANSLKSLLISSGVASVSLSAPLFRNWLRANTGARRRRDWQSLCARCHNSGKQRAEAAGKASGGFKPGVRPPFRSR